MKTKAFISKARTLLGLTVALMMLTVFLALALNISVAPYEFIVRHLVPFGSLVALYVILQYADDYLNRRFINKHFMQTTF
ncbi:MAG: hypothetical protein J6Y91_03570 [Alphaproteobacteria bacterium]|nr:hypothetical protein [Alphaproteobacteria bacterium]